MASTVSSGLIIFVTIRDWNGVSTSASLNILPFTFKHLNGSLLKVEIILSADFKKIS